MGKAALTETFLEVEKLIYSTVYRFQRRFGGDTDELIGMANELFIDAYHSYDRRSSFPYWVGYVIYKGLMAWYRKERKRASILNRVDVDTDQTETVKKFSVRQLMLDLGEDAIIVVRLLLETNNNDKSTLFRCLESLGWSVARIMESFAEITRVLTE